MAYIDPHPFSANGNALGYVRWYEREFQKMISHQYPRLKSEILVRIKTVAFSERWHFANRLLKSHTRCVPEKVALCSLSHFLCEIKNKVEDQQLTFKF